MGSREIIMRNIFFLAMLFLGKLQAEEPEPLPKSIYEVEVKSIQGQSIPLAAYRGRVLLIVNVASQDANSVQIEQLQELYEKYLEQGLVVLAFPSNDFLNSETQSGLELRAIYADKFQISYPLFDKVKVTGAYRAPLYVFLTSSKTNPHFCWEVEWNFTKFLVDRNGNVIARFNTKTTPLDPHVQEAIQKALGNAKN